MTFDDLIQLKTQILQNPSDELAKQQLDTELSKLTTEERTELDNEFQFMESLWQSPDVVETVQPSAHMKANFYQMLEQEKVTSSVNVETNAGSGLLFSLTSLFQFSKPVGQFAMLCIVFLAGMGTQNLIKPNDATVVTQLESQVEELNSMMALSLLQQPTATERLSGVSYSNRLDQLPEELVQQLLGLLTNDRSTTVRLAIIKTLFDYQNFYQIETQLLEALQTQESAMVQLQLVDLISLRGSTSAMNELQKLIDEEKLSEDVLSILSEQQQQNNI